MAKTRRNREKSIADDVLLACVLEASARKPGNVHPEASFVDLTYANFVRSAVVIAPILERAAEFGVGRTVFDAVQQTRTVLGGNTNLGIVLLLAPLACVPAGVPLHAGISDVLSRLTREDAEFAYQAIRLAKPGGLGRADAEDVSARPRVTLLEAMRLAADRDAIAAQYATNFSAVLTTGVEFLTRTVRFHERWEEAVIGLHLSLMAEIPDTLIARKCGPEVAAESARQARAVCDAGWPDGESSRRMFAELDAWLRADGHRRNPGTTADLVAAALFAAFRDGRLEPPPLPECARPVLPSELHSR